MTFTPEHVILFFLLHAIGDYVTQTDWMAKNKTSDMDAAVLHGVVYALPFYFALPTTVHAVLFIASTHALIDRYRLARYVIFAKNWLNDPTLKWAECNVTGYPNNMPRWMSVWLLIACDNTLHLIANYVALRWM